MKKFLILSLSLLFLLISIQSVNAANLVYKTDFEDVTWRTVAPVGPGESEGTLNIKYLNSPYNMYSYVHLSGYGELVIDNGTAFSNSPTPRSGSKMICTAANQQHYIL